MHLLFLGCESDDGSLSDSEDAPSEDSAADVDEAPLVWDKFSDSHDSQLSNENLDPGSCSQVLEQPSLWDSHNKQVALGNWKIVEAIPVCSTRRWKCCNSRQTMEKLQWKAHAQSTLARNTTNR